MRKDARDLFISCVQNNKEIDIEIGLVKARNYSYGIKVANSLKIGIFFIVTKYNSFYQFEDFNDDIYIENNQVVRKGGFTYPSKCDNIIINAYKELKEILGDSLRILSLEDRAVMWAEKYGIVEYKIIGYKMVYNVSYNKTLNQPRYTVQHTVNLKDMNEEPTKILKKYDPKGVYNRY